MDIFKVESIIINEITPHITFSSLILREFGLLRDIIPQIMEMMLNTHEDIISYRTAKENFICQLIIRFIYGRTMREEKTDFTGYGISDKMLTGFLHIFKNNRSIGLNYIQEKIIREKVPEKYVPPNFFPLNISKDNYNSMVKDSVDFILPLTLTEDKYRELGINEKYLSKCLAK